MIDPILAAYLVAAIALTLVAAWLVWRLEIDTGWRFVALIPFLLALLCVIFSAGRAADIANAGRPLSPLPPYISLSNCQITEENHASQNH